MLRIVIVLLTILYSSVHSRLLSAQASNDIPLGVVIDKIPCEDLPTQTYSVYLPSYYSAGKEWPVIYIFEPYANGSLAVGLYKYAAEKLGYILVASNNSRNGSWEVSVEAADAMVVDTFKKFSIDAKQVYMSGFSGGSRVASALACLNTEIAGVIGCGAGFSTPESLRPTPGMNWSYVGIVGNQDMNLHDQINAKIELDKLQMENQLILFEGGHQWPDSLILLQGLEWIHLNAMKRESIPMDQSFVKQKFDAELAHIRKENSSDNELEAYRQLVQLKNSFESIYDTNEVVDFIVKLESSKEYQKMLKKINDLYLEEDKLVRNLSRTMIELPRVRTDSAFKKQWEDELRNLFRLSHSKDKEKANMAKRVLVGLEYHCADLTIQAICQNVDDAYVYSTYWLQLQPDNFWAYWNSARIYAMLKKEGLAIRQLQKAKEKGTLTRDLLMNETAFLELRDKNSFQKLLTETSQ